MTIDVAVLQTIDVTTITPSPYQHRKYFNPEKLQELAHNIAADGLIEPIVVRRLNEGYELIAGERRLRAVQLAGLPTILARVVEATDRQARRMCAAENMQREDLSAIEVVAAIVELIDSELIEDDAYSSVAETPAERVKWVLGRLDSVRFSQERGSDVSQEALDLFHKFMEQVDRIFNNLPKPVATLRNA